MFKPFSVTGCSLELLDVGERGIVTYCETQDATIHKKLIAMGVTPGITIALEQRFPSLNIKVGNIPMIIDRETARTIYVRIINS
ncbi:FeoA family protein [Calothrix sp. PCC 7507]|uniref:FeoA family protein n=1 Tax=Calothrix sp. PCC 7507 TaxID=99598 RepID=UPI00029ED1BF|nr:FeoA family protein [Calothrix sp. PCC 7507]AFY30628.1 FeoA family protein [Calothrix sp. PCC 7507]